MSLLYLGYNQVQKIWEKLRKLEKVVTIRETLTEYAMSNCSTITQQLSTTIKLSTTIALKLKEMKYSNCSLVPSLLAKNSI